MLNVELLVCLPAAELRGAKGKWPLNLHLAYLLANIRNPQNCMAKIYVN